MLLNFGESLGRLVRTASEAEVHPHVPEEKAELFTSTGPGAAELETLTLLNALVYLFKPELVLETGTGNGYSTLALASALRSNGRGRVHTVDLDASVAEQAFRNMQTLDPDLESWITFHVGDSRDLIREWLAPPFDFAFFDSLVEFRHVELDLMLERGMLSENAMCVFHDTSRQRWHYNDDFNPQMIDALDAHSLNKQWLESTYARGLRILKLG